MTKAILSTIIFLFAAVGMAVGQPAPRRVLIDSLEHNLNYANSSADSLRTLYNIYDLTLARDAKAGVLRRLLSVADYCGDTTATTDALIHLANVYAGSDSVLDRIDDKLSKLAPSARRKEAQLFVDILRTDIALQPDSVNDKSTLDKIIRRYSDYDGDPYLRAGILYALCRQLSFTTGGELLEQYYNKLEKMTDTLALPAGAVRNLIYTRMAPVFANNNHTRRAADINKKMLNIIDSLVDSYSANGRPYRTLAHNRYVCLSRLLGNFDALTESEIWSYYHMIERLAASDPSVANHMSSTERPQIFYALASKKYKEAIPMIKRQLDNPANRLYRNFLLNELMRAAVAVGDESTQAEVATELNSQLRRHIVETAEQRYRELQIIYDINEMKQEKARLEAAARAAEKRVTKIFIIGSGSILLLLLALIFVLLRKNRKIKALSVRQAKTAERLRKERNELVEAQQGLVLAREQAKHADKMKTDFINSMSHEVKTPLTAIAEYSRLIVDCIPGEKSKYLSRFANIIDLNTKLVLRLMNDVLDIAALENGNMNTERQAVSVRDICTYALDNVFEDERSAKPGITVKFNTGNTPDRIVRTDRQRVSQVLMNLLANAEKFTETGFITLDYDYDETAERLTFTVTDTGCGVPNGQEEAIFERFRQIDTGAAGCGLGLYISRLLASLLGGTLTLDKDYRRGARFIFSIPA